MSVYVLDANTVSFYLRGHRQVIENIEGALAAGDDLMIAPIAYYEVRRGLLAVRSENRMRKFDSLCKMFSVGQLSNSILDIAANVYVQLRNTGRMVSDADIFIAAFCMQHGFTLITNNVKHFENITGLTIVDWTLPQS